jgi:myxalamid-type polyketide synthase MxaE and MxaD
VADESRVAAFVESRRREGLPEIRGVVHAAAVTDDHLLASIAQESFTKVLRPKLVGSFVLDRVFAGPEVDFFVMFSSLGSLLGPPGQGSYAAANAWLDALAHHRRRRGRHALAVNWGAWAGLGLAQSDGARRTIEELERRGVGSFSGPEGVDALGRLLDGDAAQGAVMPADWKRYAEVASRTRLPSIVRDRVSPVAERKASGPSLTERLRATEPGERRALLEEHLRSQLVAVLHIGPEKVDTQRPMGTLGLESLTALELRRRLEVSLGIALSATAMWNYPTPATLAGHLASRLGLALDSVPAGPAAALATNPPATPLDVGGLSDEEALRTLMGERGGTP